MAANVAPPKNTGGGGFVFEDYVCASFVTYLLSSDPPLMPAQSRLTRLDFQSRPDGWFFDDLLMTMSAGTVTSHCSWSIKSNTQFGAHTAPGDFVETAWEQYLHQGSTKFNADHDFMGLITTPFGTDLQASLSFVQKTAEESDSALLPGRYAADGWTSTDRIALFKSFHCPSALATAKGKSEADTGAFISRLLFLQFDFEQTVSESEKRAISRCQQALRSADYGEAQNLWAKILQLTARMRPAAGSIDRKKLLGELRQNFELREFPEFENDWRRLYDLSAMNMAQVKNSIGNGISLANSGTTQSLQEALDTHSATFLIGASGVGKSAAAVAFGKTFHDGGGRVVSLNAASFDRPNFAAFESDLQLDHSLTEVLHSLAGSRALVVLDGLDRLYVEGKFAIAASLVKLLNLHEEGNPWRLIVTSQVSDWLGVKARMLDEGIPADQWDRVEVSPRSANDLAEVWKAYPTLGRLRTQSKLQPLWGNLKILDLVATRAASGIEIDTSSWVGETNVATWYWSAYVRTGEERLGQERFAILLAEMEAAQLRSSFPLDAFQIAELSSFVALEKNGVCQTTNNQNLRFSHDLFGDWARLHVLISHSDDFPEFIRTRLASPLWHRAVRLYGIYLLENKGDINAWTQLRMSLTGGENAVGADLLLEAPIFTANPVDILSKLTTVLFENNGVTLKRLLTRFLSSSTDLDSRIEKEAASLKPHLAVLFRMPTWRDWPALLRFLYSNATEVVALAPVEVAKIIEIWYRNTPDDFLFRKELASIGLLLGQLAFKERRKYHVSDKQKKLLYRVALAGAEFFPDEVAELAKLAAARSTATEESEEDKEEDEEDNVLFGGANDELSRLRGVADAGAGSETDWDDGPKGKVDDCFRSVILDGDALIPLMRVRPQIAREVILAVMIKRQQSLEWHDLELHDRNFGLHAGDDWTTPLYSQGPFLSFLKIDFNEGLLTIASLVKFATSRWILITQRFASELTHQDVAQVPNELDDYVSRARMPPGTATIVLDGVEKILWGDDRVYVWSGSNPASAVAPALMALEKYFYDELDAQNDITNKVAAVFESIDSAAMLKVLCEVGKRAEELFATCLRPLLTVPEIYIWEPVETARGRQMLSTFLFRESQTFANAVRDFHSLPHRKRDINEIAVGLFFSDPEIRALLSQRGEMYKARLDEAAVAEKREILQRFIDTFSVANYQRINGENGEIAVINVELYRKQQENGPELVTRQRRMQGLVLPMQAQRIIDEKKYLNAEELDRYWEMVASYFDLNAIPTSEDSSRTNSPIPTSQPSQQRSGIFGRIAFAAKSSIRLLFRREANVASGPSSNGESSPPRLLRLSENVEERNGEGDQIMAVVALLLRQEDVWIGLHPERKKHCVKALCELVEYPIVRRNGDMADSVLPWSWDHFVAEAVSMLWVANPDEILYRRILARFIALCPHHSSIELLFDRLSNDRLRFRQDWSRLRRIVFEVATMRERMRFVQQYSQYSGIFDADVAASFSGRMGLWAESLVGSFVTRTTASPVVNWMEMDSFSDYEVIDAVRKQHGMHMYLDLKMVRAAHQWIAELADPCDSDERKERFEFWQGGLQFLTNRIEFHPNEKNFPFEDENWILEGIGAALAISQSGESPAILWRPILDLPGEYHRWGEHMLESFHRSGLLREVVPAQFETTRLTMINHMLDSAKGNREKTWRFSEDAWRSLVGIDYYSRQCWQSHHRQLVERSASILTRWIEEIAVFSISQLSAIAGWLQLDIAATVRIALLLNIAKVVEKLNLLVKPDRDELADNIAGLLHVIWEADATSLRSNGEGFAAFKMLLQRLVNMQNEMGLALSRKVASY